MFFKLIGRKEAAETASYWHLTPEVLLLTIGFAYATVDTLTLLLACAVLFLLMYFFAGILPPARLYVREKGFFSIKNPAFIYFVAMWAVLAISYFINRSELLACTGAIGLGISLVVIQTNKKALKHSCSKL